MEWAEVLADYDQHCHDVIKLDSRLFKTELPVHLLNEEERNTYSKDPQTHSACPGRRRRPAQVH